MTNKSESIVPIFSYLTVKGSRIIMDELREPDNFFHMCEPKDVEISLDNGTNWTTMEEVKKALELKSEYDNRCIIDPLTWSQGYHPTYQCPHCGSNELYERERETHCPCCNKQLDWSEVNEQRN